MTNDLTNLIQNQFCILLGVWGDRYIKDFLELSLPSLLAGGNIPALTKTNVTRFVFLTRSYDVNVIKQHENFEKLNQYAAIEFIAIEDLIMLGNYSTTLTLAYDRAIKETGRAMLNTYFIFLTSDYIMASGSMVGLLKYLQQGYSGVCAGNFQVIREEIEPFLKSKINIESATLSIDPRELLKESLLHLHPIVGASLYSQNFVHNYYANRFFDRVGSGTLIGRFYLLHMLCIKPELTDYKIGASCDYSFIPAMCPSGNVAIITDSDDYLVIEIQSKKHELNYLAWGPYQKKKMINALAEWTTRIHRDNAKHSIFFHVTSLSKADKEEIEKPIKTFIEILEQDLQKYPPQPFYNHPYWIGALDAFQAHKTIAKNHRNYDYVDYNFLQNLTRLRKLFQLGFGTPPFVFPWYFRYREYRATMRVLRKEAAKFDVDQVIAFYDSYENDIRNYFYFLRDKLKIKEHYYIPNLIVTDSKIEELKKHSYKLAVLIISLDSFNTIPKYLAMLQKILEENSKVMMMIPNEKNLYHSLIYHFQNEVAHRSHYLIDANFDVEKIISIHNSATFFGTMMMERIKQLFNFSKKMRILAYLVIGIPASIFCTIANCLPNLGKGHCTNIIIKFKKNKILPPITEKAMD